MCLRDYVGRVGVILKPSLCADPAPHYADCLGLHHGREHGWTLLTCGSVGCPRVTGDLWRYELLLDMVLAVLLAAYLDQAFLQLLSAVK